MSTVEAPAAEGTIETSGRTRSSPTSFAGPACHRRDRRPRWADDALTQGVEFSVARETQVLDQAFRLVHDQYVWRDYMKPHPTGRRLSLRHALPSTRVLVAMAGPRVIGTVSVLHDSPLGLPMDELFQEEMDGLRRQGRRLCEVSALAAAPGNRAESLAMLMRMLRMVLLYTAQVARLDDLCLIVHQRHVEFYEAFFAGQVLGGPRNYGKVNGAPAVALRVDLHSVRNRIARLHAGVGASSALDEFLFGIAGYRAVMAHLRREAPRARLSREQFDLFFSGSDVLGEAAAAAREYVESLNRGTTAPPRRHPSRRPRSRCRPWHAGARGHRSPVTRLRAGPAPPEPEGVGPEPANCSRP